MPNLRAVSLVVFAGCTLAAAAALAGPTSKLTVVNSSYSGISKLTYASTDAAAGIDQGTSTDLETISATVDVHIDAASGQLAFPAGSSRWIRNTDSSAKFHDRGAGTQGFDLVDGKRLKVSGPGFDLLGATTTITVAIAIDDAGETSTHCVSFEPTECVYKSSAKKEKVTCKGGRPDPTCGLPPTTTSTSTAPPPSTTSTTLVYAQAPDCCQGTDSCINGGGYTLYTNLYFHCQSLPGSTPEPGNVCGTDGQCQVYAFPEARSLCCEQPSGCYDSGGPVGLGDSAWYFRNQCYGAGGLAYQYATCAPSGNCEAQ